MKRRSTIITFILVFLIISMPLIYDTICECDTMIDSCNNSMHTPIVQNIYRCCPVAHQNANKCDCPQKITCEFQKNKPSVLITVGPVSFDQTVIKTQGDVLSPKNDPDLRNQNQLSDFSYFSERSSPFDSIYLANQSFRC